MSPLRTLGIETSCDETAVAVLDGDGRVEVNLLSSQVDQHAPFGGVVPELASREHLKALPQLVSRALHQISAPPEVVAVSGGPGLVGALLVGVRFAAAFAWARPLPLVSVDHLEAPLGIRRAGDRVGAMERSRKRSGHQRLCERRAIPPHMPRDIHDLDSRGREAHVSRLAGAHLHSHTLGRVARRLLVVRWPARPRLQQPGPRFQVTERERTVRSGGGEIDAIHLAPQAEHPQAGGHLDPIDGPAFDVQHRP